MIHIPLLACRTGMIAMGKIRATMMPLIMMVLMLLKTASTPRYKMLRGDRGHHRIMAHNVEQLGRRIVEIAREHGSDDLQRLIVVRHEQQ